MSTQFIIQHGSLELLTRLYKREYKKRRKEKLFFVVVLVVVVIYENHWADWKEISVRPSVRFIIILR